MKQSLSPFISFFLLGFIIIDYILKVEEEKAKGSLLPCLSQLSL